MTPNPDRSSPRRPIIAIDGPSGAGKGTVALAALAGRAEIDVSDGLVTVDGHDVRQAIRTPEIDSAAAAVARQPRVRQVLITQQRQMGASGGIVMEGRDIGTV